MENKIEYSVTVRFRGKQSCSANQGNQSGEIGKVVAHFGVREGCVYIEAIINTFSLLSYENFKRPLF